MTKCNSDKAIKLAPENDDTGPQSPKNKDPIAACNKYRIEEGGTFLYRVQRNQTVPEFYFDMKLIGPGLKMSTMSPSPKNQGSASPKKVCDIALAQAQDAASIKEAVEDDQEI